MGYDALAVDNVQLENGFGACGYWRTPAQWVQLCATRVPCSGRRPTPAPPHPNSPARLASYGKLAPPANATAVALARMNSAHIYKRGNPKTKQFGNS